MKTVRNRHSTPFRKKEMDTIQESALAFVENRWNSLTPHALEKHLAVAFGLSRPESRHILKFLVMEGHLAYQDQYGRTVIEKSFNRAMRVSPRIILKPPESPHSTDTADVVIQLRHGASFGTGTHPTTRMALRGLEEAVKEMDLSRNGGSFALDIGTGSGVLGIAAVLLGIERALGLDIDACAISEARENARINEIEDRFRIQDTAIASVEGPVDLILANLRLPTLIRLFPDMGRLARPNCAAVISGIKENEITDLKEMFLCNRWHPVWEETEKDWAAIVFCR